MRTHVVLVGAALSLAASVALSGDGADRSGVAGVVDAGRAVEVARIRAHFDSVLQELTVGDRASRGPAQRARRAALLATLRAYRDRGDFPHNYDFPGTAVPYFVDRITGTRCAVAHLLESTGRGDVVQRVARTDNNVLVHELADDSAFVGWLDAHGLTLAEAARIQVPYMGEENPMVSSLGSRNAVYAVGTSAVVGASLLTSFWNARGNADGHRRLANVTGFAAGALTVGFGAAALGDEGAPAVVAPLAFVAGGLATYLSTRGVLRHRRSVANTRDARAPRGAVRPSISPILPVAGRHGAGMSVRLTF